jgi:hypothetical protein
VSWRQTGDGTQAEGIYDGDGKADIAMFRNERGICKEDNQVLPALLSARQMTDLLRMLLCRNLKLSPPQKV